MPSSRTVLIPAGKINLRSDLILPEKPEGIVVFLRMHGKYGDYSYDRKMASIFEKYNLATLLFDLPMAEEHPEISQLEMLRHIADWLHQDSDTAGLPVGCFGIGAAAPVAINFITQQGVFAALTTCDSSLEPAIKNLPELDIPVLMISGTNLKFIESNQTALHKIKGHCAMNIIPHGSYVFRNLRSLEDAGQLAGLWFSEHLSK